MHTDTIPKYVVVKNMNWNGELMSGKFNGIYYVLDDGDCYFPETLQKYYESEFFDEIPNVKVSGGLTDESEKTNE